MATWNYTFEIFVHKNDGFKDIEIIFSNEILTLSLDEQEIKYKKNDQIEFGDQKWDIEDPVDLALNDLVRVIKISEKKLKIFQICFSKLEDQVQSIYFEALLKSFEIIGPLNMETCYFGSLTPSELSRILPFFEVTNIHLKTSKPNCQFSSELSNIPQWKNAKRLEAIFGNFSIPIENLRHFTRFDITVPSFTLEDALNAKKTFSESENLEHGCYYFSEMSIVEIAKIIKPDYCEGDRDLFEFRGDDNINFQVAMGVMYFKIDKVV